LKILFVATISDTVNAFLIPHIKMLIEQGHKVDVAFNIVQDVRRELIEMGCVIHTIEFQRSPLDKKNLSAYKKLKKIIQSEKYELVHTHTPVASVCARLACRKKDNIKVVYTAHGFHFFKGAPLQYWILYYPFEKFLSKYTDVLITINQEDYERASNYFVAKKTVYIPGVGLDIMRFSVSSVDRSAIRAKLGISNQDRLLLSVGELSTRKNHEVVIKAISKLKDNRLKYFICGRGPLQQYLQRLASELNVEDQVVFLGYRTDIADICQAADVFLFPSLQEGLPVALMEAMACGLPVVCSRIRGNTDLIEEGKGGFIPTPSDVDSYVEAIQVIFRDDKLRLNMGLFNKRRIENYSLEIVQKQLLDLYSELERDLDEKKSTTHS